MQECIIDHNLLLYMMKKGNQFVNFILRYENLNNDITELNKKFCLNIPIYGNKNTNVDYIQLFNKESIKKINKLYEKDFLLLNYEMIQIDN